MAVIGVISLVVLAYVAGLATRPLSRVLVDWVNDHSTDRRASQMKALSDLHQLLLELQKSSEAVGDSTGYRRYMDTNLQLVVARDHIASRRVRDVVRQCQHDVQDLVESMREEAARPPLVDEAGEVSGEEALGRVHSVLVARQHAWTGLAKALDSVSEELRRSQGRHR